MNSKGSNLQRRTKEDTQSTLYTPTKQHKQETMANIIICCIRMQVGSCSELGFLTSIASQYICLEKHGHLLSMDVWIVKSANFVSNYSSWFNSQGHFKKDRTRQLPTHALMLLSTEIMTKCLLHNPQNKPGICGPFHIQAMNTGRHRRFPQACQRKGQSVECLQWFLVSQWFLYCFIGCGTRGRVPWQLI